MAYSGDIADILTHQLTKFVSLNACQLAGQVVNLDFWLGEVRHCLDVIDRYRERFSQLRKAQGAYMAAHGLTFDTDPDDSARFVPLTRVPKAELAESRRELCTATYRFLRRCFQEKLIAEDRFRAGCRALNIEVDEDDMREKSR